MAPPHLTTVQRDGSGAHPWRATCLCGWTEEKRLKREATTAAEMHWLSMPLETGEPRR